MYEVALADGAVKPLTSRKGPDNSPAISPDGKTIAYTGFDDRYQGHQTTHLYLMDRDGSHPRLATPKLDRDVLEPSWATDGSGIYFMYDDQGDTKLAFYSLDGSVKDLAAHVAGGGSSYAGGAAFTVADKGAFAMTYTRPPTPATSPPAASPIRSRTSSPPSTSSFSRRRSWAQVEEFWFNSSVDQRKIEGWIVKPPDFDPAKNTR